MILTAGKTNVEKLLGGDAAGKKITSIVVGTSNAAVTAADSVLVNPVVVPVSNTEYLPGNVARFTGVLPSTVSAMTIAEIGLLNQDNVLVHRKVFDAPFVKAVGLAYTLKYEIKLV